jgi:hypothetical protein
VSLCPSLTLLTLQITMATFLQVSSSFCVFDQVNQDKSRNVCLDASLSLPNTCWVDGYHVYVNGQVVPSVHIHQLPVPSEWRIFSISGTQVLPAAAMSDHMMQLLCAWRLRFNKEHAQCNLNDAYFRHMSQNDTTTTTATTDAQVLVPLDVDFTQTKFPESEAMFCTPIKGEKPYIYHSNEEPSDIECIDSETESDTCRAPMKKHRSKSLKLVFRRI